MKGHIEKSSVGGAMATARAGKSDWNMGRIALIAAALIALIAIGIAVARSAGAFDSAPATPATAAAAPTPDQAIAQLETRLQKDPKDIEGWQMLGWAFFETGRYPEAATAYRRATALAPDNGVLWSSLGEALALSVKELEMPADAAAAFRKAIALDPDDPRARYFLGVEKDIGGNARGAIDDWMALLEITPAGAPWEASVRQTIEKVAERDKIDIKVRLAAIKPAPARPGVATAGIPGPSRSDMQAASKLPPGQQQAMVNGMVESLAIKLAANPRNVDGWIMLMRSRMTLGQAREASEALSAAVAANPAAAARLKTAASELGIAS